MTGPRNLSGAEMRLDQDLLDGVVARMLAPPDFFDRIWARAPFHAPGAARACVGLYDGDDFLEDIARARPGPHLVVGAPEGARAYSYHDTAAGLRAAVEAGGVAPLRISDVWHQPDAPERFAWMRALFGSLFRAVSMIYLNPERSENVDLFYAGPGSHLGVHYDTSHTFTIQLSGRRKWVVAETVRLDETLAAERAPDFAPDAAAIFSGPTREIVLMPGDALYVPAYCVHGVTGVPGFPGSVSIGLGIRAFNEIDVVARLLEIVENTRYAAYPPVATCPAGLGAAHRDAKAALVRRVRALLRELDLAVTGIVEAGLHLPDTLGPIAEGAAEPEPAGALRHPETAAS
ncbi:hypothetical protein VP06_23375 [Methylobacterium aquaticum]|uniref:JmjC domain-containing protein n=2 Tax=Methylobacterium aquaticum TaxID=270351 RepID=A0A0J6S3X0_9HYPH|nr:hypothetical protein VP06_23375 [Methylobacterium aquaticum]